MIRNNVVCVVGMVIAMASVAHAQAAWDSRGWVNLGERTVNGRMDHDRIEVGRYEGRFSKLTLVVENADVEMLDVRVEFGDRTDFHPPVTGFYREGTRTRVIEMPGGDRVIRFIDFRYRNAPGEWHAKVGVWALRDGAAAPVANAPVWDANGWTMLGEREVHGHGRENADRISVGRYEGRFAMLTVVVLDSDLEMIDMGIKFGRGPEVQPSVAQFFREGTRTRVIELPTHGDGRTIRWIEFKYRNLPGEAHARVQVWAK